MKNRLLRALSVILLVLLVAASSQPALAQSNVTLLLHDTTVQPIQGTATYDVALYFSLLDTAGNPIKDAAAGDFTLTEDGQQVQIGSLALANDEPISVAILLDTSGSMLGGKIAAARQAASRFIENLAGGDRIAVLTFDRTTTHQIDFTSDHTAARQNVELIQATPGGVTCLYDAIYETIHLIAAEPAGRRAIIVLTDGRDEAESGQPCSAHTTDEVIGLAAAASTRVPLYTIGLGNDIDTAVLGRLAGETSGRAQYAPGTTQLDALFGRLTDELRSRYVLHYTSAASGGKHTLTLRFNRNNVQDQASLEVNFPLLPYVISFTSPTENAKVSGVITIAISISGQGAPIQKVLFLANGVNIGSDSEPPYELKWDPSGLEAGPVFLEAVAQSAVGAELARSGVTITYQPVEATVGPAAPAESSTSKLPLTTIIGRSALIGLLLLIGIVGVVLFAAKRRQQKQAREREWQEKVQASGAPPAIGMDDRTLDAFTPSENALGVLVVLQSDDPSLIHQRFEISKTVTYLGRKAVNDIIFPADSTVSRQHAVIEERNRRLYLSEVITMDEHGRPKAPTYGTFVNGEPLKETRLLRDGDEIQLGKRLRLRFEAVHPLPGEDDKTLDQWSGDEKTMDSKLQ